MRQTHEIVPRSKREARPGVVTLTAVFILLAIVSAVSVAHAELPPLIPRDVLFPKPAAMQSLGLSPDGRWLSYIAADDAGTPQVWIRDLDGAGSRRLTKAPAPGVASYLWAENGLVCYELRKNTGSRLIGVEIASGKERILFAVDGATFMSPVARPAAPDELLLSARLPNTQEDDVYRINLITGTAVLDTKNPGRVPGYQFFADRALVVRAAQRTTENGGIEVLVRDGPSAPWRSWMTADSSYNLAIEAFTEDGTALLLRSDIGADKARLIARTIENGKEHVIATANDLDVEKVLLQPRTGAVQAVSFLSDPRRWEAIDPSVGTDLRRMRRIYPGRQVNIASRDLADRRWLMWIGDDHSSPRACLWNRLTRRATLLFEEQPHLAGLPLARVKPISFKARDGFRIHGYLTLPVGVPARRLPLVVWVHGGPYLRDAWGYDNTGQLFANRGYAFLRVNFRGSRGFGRQFKVASFKQWGGTMQNDIVDAVHWVVRSGVADPNRMAVIGHSYGGYVALAALVLTPDLFACAAASSTTANLVAFLNNFPKTPGNAWLRTTIGDPEIPKDAEVLRSVSPSFHVDRVIRPFLVAWGDQDAALPPGDLDSFVAEVKKRGQQAEAVLYEGDGHFFRRENQLDYFARVEALFARCLGGRAEPMAGTAQAGSTARVKTAGR
ncbi:MAG: alpha/beta fold hydrolase [Acidobacteriota bacterium]